MTNVRFVLCNFETDDTYGVQSIVVSSDVLEGHLQEVSDRVIGQLSGPSTSQKMPAQFKLAFTTREIYNAETDEFVEFYSAVEAGSALQFVAYRHPKLKIWIDYPSIEKIYVVSAISDIGYLGRHKIASLKEQEN